MLDSIFKTAAVIARYRKGLFGPHLDGYVEKLFASGYGVMTIHQHVHVSDKLFHWMRKHHYGFAILAQRWPIVFCALAPKERLRAADLTSRKK